MYICMYVFICLYVYVYMYICIYVYMYIWLYMYICMYICIYDLDDPHREPGSICKVLVLWNLKTGLLLLGHKSNHHTSQPPGDTRHVLTTKNRIESNWGVWKIWLNWLSIHKTQCLSKNAVQKSSTRLLFSVRPYNFHKEHRYPQNPLVNHPVFIHCLSQTSDTLEAP